MMDSRQHDIEPATSLHDITSSHHRGLGESSNSLGDISIAQSLLKCSKLADYSPAPLDKPSLRRESMIDATCLDSLSSYSIREQNYQAVIQTSNTWTSSSGGRPSRYEDNEDRTEYIEQYNRLATKHGIRELTPDDYDTDTVEQSGKSSWFRRNILRRTSSTQSVQKDGERHLKHRRSISDLSARLKTKKDTLKDKNLQELARLCGISLLYLPPEYATHSLPIPTCFRATAQYLVQYGVNTRGVFRIPGSQSVVSALYNHFSTFEKDEELVAGTVHCPTLPSHIKCDVHDVASAFKRFLCGLPNGIIGSLSVFYAFVSIISQLDGRPEINKTKQSKIRARLIALAILTIKSQYRRDLICAILGLLSMIGRSAEISQREDDRGRPLPTSDLMGYKSLGIIFGPLLMGELLDNYTIRVANPHGPLVLLPGSPPKLRKEKQSHTHMRKRSKSSLLDKGTTFNDQVDKVKVANDVTEMLITHWRDVVRHMKALQQSIVSSVEHSDASSKRPILRPSASESFTLRKPPFWSTEAQADESYHATPTKRVESGDWNSGPKFKPTQALFVKKQRSSPQPALILRPKLQAKPKADVIIKDYESGLLPSDAGTLKASTATISGCEPTNDRSSVLDSSEGAKDATQAQDVKLSSECSPLQHSILKVTISRPCTQNPKEDSSAHRLAATALENSPLRSGRPQSSPVSSARNPRGIESMTTRDRSDKSTFVDDTKSLPDLGQVLEIPEPMIRSENRKARSRKSMTVGRKLLTKSPPKNIQLLSHAGSQSPQENSPLSSMRIMRKFGSSKSRHSNKSSYTADASPRHKRHGDLVVSIETGTSSSVVAKGVDGPHDIMTPGPSKSVPRTGVNLESSPHGTVKALAAKFNNTEKTALQSPSKTPSKGSIISNQIKCTTQNKPVIAAYTVNRSPSRSPKMEGPDVAEVGPQPIIRSLSKSASGKPQVSPMKAHEHDKPMRHRYPEVTPRSSSKFYTRSNKHPLVSGVKTTVKDDPFFVNTVQLHSEHAQDGLGTSNDSYTFLHPSIATSTPPETKQADNAQDHSKPTVSPSVSNNPSITIHRTEFLSRGSKTNNNRQRTSPKPARKVFLGKDHIDSTPVLHTKPFRVPNSKHSTALEADPFFSKSKSAPSLSVSMNPDATPLTSNIQDDNFYLQSNASSLPSSNLNHSMVPTTKTIQGDSFYSATTPITMGYSPNSLPHSKDEPNGPVGNHWVSDGMPNVSPSNSIRMKSSETSAVAVSITDQSPTKRSVAPKSITTEQFASPSKLPRVRFDQHHAHGVAGTISSFDGTFCEASKLGSTEKQPPLRSTSQLSALLLSSRKELEEKTEEIRRLKQQLSVRVGSVEVALHARLRSANEQIRAWQRRAENAEKELEALKTSTARKPSYQLPHIGNLIKERSQAEEESPESISQVVEQIQRALSGGLDGAMSSESLSAERKISSTSSDTIIRSIGTFDNSFIGGTGLSTPQSLD